MLNGEETVGEEVLLEVNEAEGIDMKKTDQQRSDIPRGEERLEVRKTSTHPDCSNPISDKSEEKAKEMTAQESPSEGEMECSKSSSMLPSQWANGVHTDTQPSHSDTQADPTT